VTLEPAASFDTRAKAWPAWCLPNTRKKSAFGAFKTVVFNPLTLPSSEISQSMLSRLKPFCGS